MQLLKKYGGFALSSGGLLVTGVLVATSALLGWKLYIQPSLKRRRHKHNQEFAYFIFEERQKNNGEHEQQ